jgi:hypothetical protein
MGFAQCEVPLIKIQPIGYRVEAFQRGHCFTPQFYKMFSDCCFSRFTRHESSLDNLVLVPWSSLFLSIGAETVDGFNKP